MSTKKTPAKKTPAKAAPKTAPKKPAKQAAPKKLGACARVWEIADSMKDTARKDVIAACVAQGINVFTARTQYQRFLHRGDK